MCRTIMASSFVAGGSFAFFHRIIAEDTAAREPSATVSIVDLGFGLHGYGCTFFQVFENRKLPALIFRQSARISQMNIMYRANVDYLIED